MDKRGLSSEDLLEDDPKHPIPYVGLIDSKLSLKSGKLWYGLAAAGPLHNDIRTRERLAKKLEAYLADFHSPEAIVQFGTPTVETCRIYVGLPKESAPEIFELLTRMRPWVEKHGVALMVREIRDQSDDDVVLQ